MRIQITWAMALTLLASPALTYGADTATEPAETAKLNLKNVELSAVGSLEGRILTPTGAPVPGAKLVVRSQKDVDKVSQEIVTDDSGRFRINGLNTGACIVETKDDTFAVRVWKKGTAPPKSLSKVAFIHETGDTVRGNWLTNSSAFQKVRCMTKAQKCGLALLIGAAIAIPIALDDDGS